MRLSFPTSSLFGGYLLSFLGAVIDSRSATFQSVAALRIDREIAVIGSLTHNDEDYKHAAFSELESLSIDDHPPHSISLPMCRGSVSPRKWSGCVGELSFPSIGLYFGEFQDGRRHGTGTMFLDDGSVYAGDFQYGRMTGRGVARHTDGSTYRGEFVDGLQEGWGEYAGADGQKYIGEYKGGKPHGWGYRIYASGRRYYGEFRDGVREGQGTLVFEEGSTFVGEFREDLGNGPGTIHHVKGDKFVGEFRDGLRDGFGRHYSAKGCVVREGIWRKGDFYRVSPDVPKSKNMCKVTEEKRRYPLPTAPR